MRVSAHKALGQHRDVRAQCRDVPDGSVANVETFLGPLKLMSRC